jgi:phosphoribosylglycinamide formyltransferase-1
VIETAVDAGRLLMISAPLAVEVPPGADLSDRAVLREAADANQERLKKAGDWLIFPRTLEYIADGRYEANDQGRLFFDGRAIPKGLRLEG